MPSYKFSHRNSMIIRSDTNSGYKQPEQSNKDKLEEIKKSIKKPNTYDKYIPSPNNINFYTNGQHRRLTDPITGIESSNALKLLFGPGTSTNNINELLNRNTLLDSINNTIADLVTNKRNGFTYTDNIENAINSYKIKNEQIKYVSELDGVNANISIGTLALAPQEDPSLIFKINQAIKNNTIIPKWKRELVLEIDNPNPVLNGIIDSKIYSITIFIHIDVTNPYNPFINLDKIYSTYGGALGMISTNNPPTIPISDYDKNLLIKLLNVLLPPNFIKNIGSKIKVYSATEIEEGQFAISYSPFSYLGDNTMYGTDNENNYAAIFYAYIDSQFGDGNYYNYSTAHLRFNTTPITCIVSKNLDKAPQNTLQYGNNIHSTAICFNFFNRGILLQTTDIFDSNFNYLSDELIRHNYYNRVLQAWNTDTINDITVISLFDENKYLNFKNLENISYIQNKVNFDNAKNYKTMVDNPDEYKPPDNKFIDSNTIEQIAIDGPDYKIDGYNISWNGWNFNIGFNITMGLELYGISFTPPPTLKEPNPEPIQYFYNVNIPHLSTIYTSIDGVASTNFDDTGFYLTGKYLTNILKDGDCIGIMSNLPVYKTWNQTNSDPNKISGPGHTYNNTFGNFYPRDNLDIENYTINNTNHKRYAYEEIRGWTKGICIQEKDGGVILKHHNSVRRGKLLTVTSFFTMNFYCYEFQYCFNEEGGFNVNINASGLPLTYCSYNLSASNALDGVDTRSANHKHIYTVAFECAVNKQLENAYDTIQAVDKNIQGDYGVTIKNEKHIIQSRNDLDNYGKYDHSLKRSFYIDSYLNNKYLGALTIHSNNMSVFTPLKI